MSSAQRHESGLAPHSSDVQGRALACVADVLASINAARLHGAELEEVVAAMTTADRRRLFDAAGTDLEQAENDDALIALVARLLADLVKRGRAVLVDGGYVAVDDEDAMNGVVGVTTSRRKKTLAIAERVVAHLGRAVRACDVADYVREHLPQATGEYQPLLTILARDLQSLRTTGDLVAVGRVRGRRTDGTVLYLPARLGTRREEFLPKSPLTWLDYLVSVLRALWGAREEEARAAGRLPRPLTTKEVRARLRSDLGHDGKPVATSRWGQDLDDPMTVQLALDTLSRGSSPEVSAVPGRAALWIPANVDRKAVDLDVAFATDADRAVEATRRAMARLGLPAVTAADVAEEIALDDALTLSRATSAARVLSGLAKKTVSDGSGKRQPRRHQRIHQIGRKRGAALYCASVSMPENGGNASPELQAAKRYADREAVLRDVSALNWEMRLAALGRVRSSVISLGRARLLAADLGRLIPAVERIAVEGSEDAAVILSQLKRAHDTTMGWCRFRRRRVDGIPSDVCQQPPVLTPGELQALFAPVSPTAAALKDAGAVVRHYWRLIKRVPNPAFTDRRSGNPLTAQQYLFDAVDARCYGVRLWGGAQARLAALMAEDELGELRDGRYVLLALASGDLEQRLRAIASIAFLQPDGGAECLRQRAHNDESPGVRELAIWALGFCQADDADAIAREAAAQDPSIHVRQSAQRWLNAGPAWGWHS